MRASHVPGTVLGSLPSSFDLILMDSCAGNCYHPHFTKAEAKTWRVAVCFHDGENVSQAPVTPKLVLSAGEAEEVSKRDDL